MAMLTALRGRFQRAGPEPLLAQSAGAATPAEITVLNIHHKRIDHTPANLPPLDLQISVCTDGEHQLTEVLDLFGPRIEVVQLQLTTRAAACLPRSPDRQRSE